MRNRGARPADGGLPGGDLADADLQHVPHDHVVELLACYPAAIVAFIRRTDARQLPLETDPSGTKRYTAHYSSSVVCHLLISRSFTVAGG
jgi:hypothetical protein